MGADKNRILLVTPEITYLPQGMGNLAHRLMAKAGGLADVSASLVSTLYEAGMDVHVALPNYRTMFNRQVGNIISERLEAYRMVLPQDRIHLAEDRCFYYRDKVYDNYAAQNMKLSLAFQREVINNILPRVQPNLIHCNDWMTGLIPAVARRLEIPSLFTVHNIHSLRTNLSHMEDQGLDAAQFWPFLYFDRPPENYEETRETNPVDFLCSGVFAATAINTVSPTFLTEIISGKHPFVAEPIKREFTRKYHSGRALGVLNAPAANYHPARDKYIPFQFDSNTHFEGKRRNKQLLQKRLGLIENPDAPIFFWPSRLDPVQKGCALVAEILVELVMRYRKEDLQVVFVANGPYQDEFHNIVDGADLHNTICVADFDEGLSRHAYAGSDFVFMPSSFEPCGLPQMVGTIYGTLPIAHNTGGLHDTVRHISVGKNQGNGFLFDVHDVAGLRWAADQAMQFHRAPLAIKNAQISRIMCESEEEFSQKVNTRKYMTIYEHLLKAPDLFPK